MFEEIKNLGLSFCPQLRKEGYVVVMNDIKRAVSVITELFGGIGGDETKNQIMSFANAGRLLGTIFGGVLDGIITSLRIVGDLIGQVAAAILTFDFSNFDLTGVKDKLKGFAARVGIIDKENVIPSKVIEAATSPKLKLVPPAAVAPPQSVTATPAVATANANASINGQITVSASEGSKVDSVESKQIFKGPSGKIGLGVAAP